MRPVMAAVALTLATPAAAETMYRCRRPDGTEEFVNTAGRHFSWVKLTHCKPVDLAPHAAPKTAKCWTVVYPRTTFQRCVQDGMVWATSLNATGAPATGAGSRIAGTEASRPVAVDPGMPHPRTTSARPDLDPLIARAAREHKLPEALLRAVIMVESGFHPDVVSPMGAQGLMQLMPITADMLQVDDPFDPEQNILAGAKFLRMLSDRFHGDVERTLASYFAGPTAVARAGGAPTDRSVQYVRKVMTLYKKYAGDAM